MSPSSAARAFGWNFDLVTLGSDLRLFAAGAAAAIAGLREAYPGYHGMGSPEL